MSAAGWFSLSALEVLFQAYVLFKRQRGHCLHVSSNEVTCRSQRAKLRNINVTCAWPQSPAGFKLAAGLWTSLSMLEHCPSKAPPEQCLRQLVCCSIGTRNFLQRWARRRRPWIAMFIYKGIMYSMHASWCPFGVLPLAPWEWSLMGHYMDRWSNNSF
jgi:hypothetical protein